MSTIYLHHYPESPFCEKARSLLGYLGFEWNSVITPMIMPRPLLMPLTGGYRKTPVGQIGANVYCDTKILARALAEHAGDDELYAHGFAAHRVADWADTQLFRVAVALNFRPEAVGPMLQKGGLGGVSMDAFMKDRAELSAGASITTFSANAAEGFLLHYLTELDDSLGSGFLFGDRPSIADFSVYHCLWFLLNSPYNAPLIQARPKVMAFVERMRGFGQGKSVASTGEAALAAARAAEPVLPERVALQVPCKVGDTVAITPIDYGRVPVQGELVCADAQQFALRRETEEAGTVVTHFPRAGFDINA